jgi:2-polyprenyl-3-methyl-5-hydroxy-6-metoxy-1,4-benzoquinol methylase
MTTSKASIDREILKEKQQIIGSYATGMLQSGVIWLGVDLGLFRALSDGEPRTAGQLAGELELSERVALEWLRAAAAGGLLEYAGDDAFRLGPEVASLLADEKNIASLIWPFMHLPSRVALWPHVRESFATGVGYGWDMRGREGIEWMEAGFRNWYEQVLVQRALPAIDGLVPALERGMVAADVGCGAGVACVEMARAFPRSEIHGYDTSRNAIARARHNATEAALSNVAFHVVPDELLPDDHSLGLVTTFDCMHDMTRPHDVAQAIRAAIADDGVWFIADIDGRDTFDANLADNPLSARFYANSLFGCLQSALSEPDGAGYGTLGLPEGAMRELATWAGFSRFRRVDLPSPINAFYEARP